MKRVFRVTLGLFLSLAGLAHLTVGRTEFLAQVPPWSPLDPDLVVILSGLVEIVLGAGFLFAKRRLRFFGIMTALFFVAIFPGNVTQYLEHRNAFGLVTDEARFIRLFFQPVLIWWALWVSKPAKA